MFGPHDTVFATEKTKSKWKELHLFFIQQNFKVNLLILNLQMSALKFACRMVLK